MQIDALWKELEAEAESGKGAAGGWLLRLARPTTDCSLFVGLELATARKAVLIQLPTDSVPPRRSWPRSKGLEPLAVTLQGQTHFGVALKEKRFSDVFTALIEDLVRRVAETNVASAKARMFLGQLARWQKFLSASLEGLTERQQRGLWGELFSLREHLLPNLGTNAVMGWTGSNGAHQDFQFQYAAIEVKTTLAKQPQVVRITSERQLDTSTWSALFLNVIAVETSEAKGESLPTMVASIRGSIAEDARAQEQFEDELLNVGYLDVHASRYHEKRYVIRADTFFHVRPGFPCIVENDMPSGIGDINYALSIASCEAFKVSSSDATSALQGKSPQNSRRKKRA